jgi:NADH-quinone oxidoreductase subunit N
MSELFLPVVLPETVLAGFAMLALLWGAYVKRPGTAELVLWLTAAALIATGFWVGFGRDGTATAFAGGFIDDAFARFAKVVILWSAAAILILSREDLARHRLMQFEFPVLITLATVGMMTMVSAGDLLVLYMGLELQSLALYVVAAFRRDDLKSTEAGLKYFVLGALSSGLLLYGASLIYGYTGATGFTAIAGVAGAEGLSPGLLFGLVFLCTGLAFKVSAAPFHMWTPDVYEGAPTPATAFFATAPKAAATALFARVLYDAFGASVADWQQILTFLAIASMFLGAIAGIGQRDIKRLMAYSSISHMGFALMGLAAGTPGGAQALLIYVAIYGVMNIGTFAFILNMEKDGRPVTEIAALGLYSRAEPTRALALAVLMFSLAGVPPLAGFFGKFYVLKASVDAGLVWLAIAGVLASVIGAFYYLRIVYLMYFGEEADALNGRMPAMHWIFLGGSALIMVAGVVNLFGIEPVAAAAAEALIR